MSLHKTMAITRGCKVEHLFGFRYSIDLIERDVSITLIDVGGKAIEDD